MAKKMKKIISMIVALAMCFSFLATPAAARENNKNEKNEDTTSTEWYKVYVNGTLIASDEGDAGNHTWLVNGVYEWDVIITGTSMYWKAGAHSDTVELSNYISIPDGYVITENGYTVEHKTVEGVNTQQDNFDNAIINVTINVLYNPETGDEVEVDESSTPSSSSDPEESKPVETAVTVNHIYKTYDAYTGLTTEDGRTSGTESATEGDDYTATAIPTYNGNAYIQQTENSALTIVIKADASQNVINIEYLRSIDTTPVDYEPVLEITKTAEKNTYKTGETVKWTITVKNVSAYTAYDVVITDELTNESWNIAALAPGAKCSFVATLRDARAGTIENIAEVDWTDGDEIPDEDEPEEVKHDEDESEVEVKDPVDYEPVLEITKTADKAVYEVGETITWTITVKNISKYTAYDVRIVDGVTDDSWTIDALAPGASRTFTAYTENAQPGQIQNVVVVSWTDGDEIPDEEEPEEKKQDSDDEIVDVIENFAPVLDVIKLAEKSHYEIGETITWNILVKNISEYTAYDVVIVDDLTGDRWTIEELAPGAEVTYTTSMVAEEIGIVKNVVVSTWTDGDDIPDEDEPEEPKKDQDEEEVIVEEPADPAPVLRIVKTSFKYLYNTGDTVTWYITVENISEYTAYDVVIVDDLTGDIWKINKLEPGASRTFAATTENAKAGYITNVAKVTWTDGDDIPDAEETDEIKSGSDDAMVLVQDPTPDPVPVPANDDGQIIIDDEDVPLASAPKTGDISGILEIISLFSLGGVILLSRKKEEE